MDVALAVGAAGVHLGEHDLPVAAARRVAGPAVVVGGTARNPQRAAALVAAAVQVPVIAIGGVSAARVPQLLAAGAHGVAVVSAVGDAADPKAATKGLLRALGQAGRPC